MAKLELDRVSYRYAGQPGEEMALREISLKVEEGEFLCVLGRSGCGKSTLLRLLAGLALPTKGKVLLNGGPVTGPGTDRAMVFQNYTLFPWLSARRNVEFGIRQARPSLSRAQVREAAELFLDQVDMLPDAGKYPYQLSGGMRQRVAIARSLAMDTEILLMDEPFGALDPRIRRELQELTEALSGGGKKTVVFVTHDVREAVYLADRVVYMEPCGIARELTVPLAKPRNRLSPDERAQLKMISGELQELFEHEGVEA